MPLYLVVAMQFKSCSLNKAFIMIVRVSVLISLFLLNSVNAQQSDTLLDALENEASNLQLDDKTKNKNKKLTSTNIKSISHVKGGAITDLTSGLSVELFEKILKENYIGSYLFYKRLSQSKKDEVFEFYQKNPDSVKVRKKILQVNKK